MVGNMLNGNDRENEVKNTMEMYQWEGGMRDKGECSHLVL